jgi:hypothetical protein
MNHQRLQRANSCIRERNARTAIKYKTMRQGERQHRAEKRG